MSASAPLSLGDVSVRALAKAALRVTSSVAVSGAVMLSFAMLTTAGAVSGLWSSGRAANDGADEDRWPSPSRA